MATCRECLHVEACKELIISTFHIVTEKDVERVIDVDNCCRAFKDKSQYAEVKHGEWDTTDTPLGRCCICSVCGSCPTMEYNYCPYCGAKMDGGKDG